LHKELQEELQAIQLLLSKSLFEQLKSLLELLHSKKIAMPSFLTPYQEGNPDLVLIEWESPKFAIVTLGKKEEIRFEKTNQTLILPNDNEIVLSCIQKYLVI